MCGCSLSQELRTDGKGNRALLLHRTSPAPPRPVSKLGGHGRGLHSPSPIPSSELQLSGVWARVPLPHYPSPAPSRTRASKLRIGSHVRGVPFPPPPTTTGTDSSQPAGGQGWGDGLHWRIRGGQLLSRGHLYLAICSSLLGDVWEHPHPAGFSQCRQTPSSTLQQRTSILFTPKLIYSTLSKACYLECSHLRLFERLYLASIF